jgi:hypothetical protein
LKSGLRDWKEESKYWKVDWEIYKRNINIEKLIERLKGGIKILKSGLRDWEEEYNHWKVDWEIERRNINIENWIERLEEGM